MYRAGVSEPELKPEPNATLPQLREAIDAIDDELLDLLNRRAGLVERVGLLKQKTEQPFFVPGREQQILERLALRNQQQHGAFPTEAIPAVWKEIVSACLSLEKSLRIAFLGPEATFTHAAARQRFGLSARYLSCGTVAQVFREVERGEADLGCVPVENSTEGVVSSTLDVFLESSLTIVSEVVLRIRHNLVGSPALGDMSQVTKVYSHPQALAQGARLLEANLPLASRVEVASTALAAQLARDDSHGAAIASDLAARLYDLKIVRAHIEDESNNVTRFLVVSKQPQPRTRRDKTSLMFSVSDEPGVLYRVLRPLADRRVNLSRIESRPSRRRPWEYVFFVDLDGHRDDAEVKAGIEEVAAACERFKILGSYPRAEQTETLSSDEPQGSKGKADDETAG